MSTEALPKGHRHTRSAAIPPSSALSQNPQNPHHLNMQAHARNTQSNSRSNDADSLQAVQPKTPPRTPKRNNRSSFQDASNSAGPENGSKQKNRNKNRPKNVMTSPAVVRNNRSTPPLTGAGAQSTGMPSSAKPVNTPLAYAGSTFHASPAPSALPIPSFYSKSVPDSPGIKGLKSLKDAPVSGGNLFTPPAPSAATNEFQREESPLDFFFNADRAEKARARSAASAQTPATGPFRPPASSPHATNTPPPSSARSQRNQKQVSPSGMFAMELDGERNSGTSVGLAFSTPYAERINAARSTPSGRVLQQPFMPTKEPVDNGEALKAYLFSDQSYSSSETSNQCDHNVSTPSAVSARPTPNGLQNARFPQRAPPQAYPFHQQTKSSNNIPRQTGRSGLRQEVTPNTTPNRILNNSNYYNESAIPPRNPGVAPSYENNLNGKFVPYVPAQASSNGIISGNRSADLRGMEEGIRKMLKIRPNETN